VRNKLLYGNTEWEPDKEGKQRRIRGLRYRGRSKILGRNQRGKAGLSI